MGCWDKGPTDKEVVHAIVPALDLEVDNELCDLEWPTRQKVQLTLNKFGAEVLMKTIMCTVVPEDFPPGPRKVCFGERSAVLMWLSSTKDYVLGTPVRHHAHHRAKLDRDVGFSRPITLLSSSTAVARS